MIAHNNLVPRCIVLLYSTHNNKYVLQYLLPWYGLTYYPFSTSKSYFRSLWNILHNSTIATSTALKNSIPHYSMKELGMLLPTTSNKSFSYNFTWRSSILFEIPFSMHKKRVTSQGFGIHIRQRVSSPHMIYLHSSTIRTFRIDVFAWYLISICGSPDSVSSLEHSDHPGKIKWKKWNGSNGKPSCDITPESTPRHTTHITWYSDCILEVDAVVRSLDFHAVHLQQAQHSQ